MRYNLKPRSHKIKRWDMRSESSGSSDGTISKPVDNRLRSESSRRVSSCRTKSSWPQPRRPSRRVGVITCSLGELAWSQILLGRTTLASLVILRVISWSRARSATSCLTKTAHQAKVISLWTTNVSIMQTMPAAFPTAKRSTVIQLSKTFKCSKIHWRSP